MQNVKKINNLLNNPITNKRYKHLGGHCLAYAIFLDGKVKIFLNLKLQYISQFMEVTLSEQDYF